MLVPVRGGVENLQKRNRTIFSLAAQLKKIPIPKVFIFNVSDRKFVNRVGGGKGYTIPACKPGREYSDPVVIDGVCLSEVDLADGNGTMGVVSDPGLSGMEDINGTEKFVIGVANDVIGMNSCGPDCSLTTTNLEWFGVFATANNPPEPEEVEQAEAKWCEMNQLIYAQGAEKVQAGEKVAMIDRPLYNKAAECLGVKPLWGSLDHTRASCPECHEDIIEGATFCKHCQQPIDAASVASRAKKRAKQAKELEAEAV
jgi:hypothetical protein